MDTTAEPQSHKRLIIVTWGALVWGFIVFARLVHLQVIDHPELARKAKAQQTKTVSVEAMRGTIYTRDRGKLAMSIPIDTIVVNPMQIPDVDFATSMLASTLNLDAAKLEADLMRARTERRGWLKIKEQASQEEVDRLRSYKFDWATVEVSARRVHPKGMLASNLLGTTNASGRGDGGVELALDEDLDGQDGRMMVHRDSRSRGYGREYDGVPMPGRDVTLTIDEGIQFATEQRLREAIEAENLPYGSAVVMHVKTGDILAMASWPTFDPEQPIKDRAELANRLNQAVAAPFEPGSVCKVITLSAAIETTPFTPETPINCGNGSITLFGRVIHDGHNRGIMPLKYVLAKSSNVGAINIGMRVGEQNLYKYMTLFGFGKSTGLPLPSEARGRLAPTRQWGSTTIASVSIGHEMMVTTIQLAQAASIIANNGRLIKPRLVLKRQRAGEPDEIEPIAEPEQRLKPETAIAMRSMMELVVLEGTGKGARLKGYTAGGKTGTAQMFDHQIKKYVKRYNSSFMGMAPLTNPEIVVVVTLNGTAQQAGTIAAPVFRDIAQTALRILGVPKDLPDTEAKPEPVKPPAPESVNEVVEPDVRQQNLALIDDGVPAEPVAAGPKVPDFKGMTLRAVLEKSTAEGIHIDTVGSGIARRQDPPAGSVLLSTRRIRVVFAR